MPTAAATTTSAITRAVASALEQSRLARSKVVDTRSPDDQMPLIGRSAAMQDVYRMITRVLRNDLTVLHVQDYNSGSIMGLDNQYHSMGGADGDFEAATEALRIKGAAKAAKRGGERTASNGIVAAADGKISDRRSGGFAQSAFGKTRRR